jgi:Smg protein
MFDILVYLFENYYQAQAYPDYDTLGRKLHAAGFENDDIEDALDWLNSLTRKPDEGLPESLDAGSSFRGYTADESPIAPDRGFIAFLQRKIHLLRASHIERAMTCQRDRVWISWVVVLMVLWTRRGNVDALVLDELIPDGEKRRVH